MVDYKRSVQITLTLMTLGIAYLVLSSVQPLQSAAMEPTSTIPTLGGLAVEEGGGGGSRKKEEDNFLGARGTPHVLPPACGDGEDGQGAWPEHPPRAAHVRPGKKWKCPPSVRSAQSVFLESLVEIPALTLEGEGEGEEEGLMGEEQVGSDVGSVTAAYLAAVVEADSDPRQRFVYVASREAVPAVGDILHFVTVFGDSGALLATPREERRESVLPGLEMVWMGKGEGEEGVKSLVERLDAIGMCPFFGSAAFDDVDVERGNAWESLLAGSDAVFVDESVTGEELVSVLSTFESVVTASERPKASLIAPVPASGMDVFAFGDALSSSGAATCYLYMGHYALRLDSSCFSEQDPDADMDVLTDPAVQAKIAEGGTLICVSSRAPLGVEDAFLDAALSALVQEHGDILGFFFVMLPVVFAVIGVIVVLGRTFVSNVRRYPRMGPPPRMGAPPRAPSNPSPHGHAHG